MGAPRWTRLPSSRLTPRNSASVFETESVEPTLPGFDRAVANMCRAGAPEPAWSENEPADEAMCRLDPEDPRSKPVPATPLAAYTHLEDAIGAADLGLLQQAAIRREHLLRGLPYDGPPGLHFAQGPLSVFLPTGASYMPRDELLAEYLPAMLDAAKQNAPLAPFVQEIARNEAARNYLEPFFNRSRIVSVELVDPEGKSNTASRLKFVVDTDEVRDYGGLITLASLEPLARSSLELEVLRSQDEAEQLAKLVLLQSKTEAVKEKVLPLLMQVIQGPGKFANCGFATATSIW
jgi:hypothetical protein